MSQRLSFSRSLYSKESLDAAIEAYAGIARIELVDEPQNLTAVFHTESPLEADVMDEFANYVLSETIVHRPPKNEAER